CNEALQALFEKANLVLAKGQANYETLEGTSFAGDKTFFLLRAKCPVVAENLGVRVGSSVFICNYR
ncbi:MAG: ARMT1-like domain-containing protein, partial [Thermacetogeniaceae bacterium]